MLSTSNKLRRLSSQMTSFDSADGQLNYTKIQAYLLIKIRNSKNLSRGFGVLGFLGMVNMFDT